MHLCECVRVCVCVRACVCLCVCVLRLYTCVPFQARARGPVSVAPLRRNQCHAASVAQLASVCVRLRRGGGFVAGFAAKQVRSGTDVGCTFHHCVGTWRIALQTDGRHCDVECCMCGWRGTRCSLRMFRVSLSAVLSRALRHSMSSRNAARSNTATLSRFRSIICPLVH